MILKKIYNNVLNIVFIFFIISISLIVRIIKITKPKNTVPSGYVNIGRKFPVRSDINFYKSAD